MEAHVLGAPHQRGGQAALGLMVAAVGRRGFAGSALAALNHIVQAGSWSVYRVWSDRPPVMYLSASQGVADSTEECFRAYRDGGLYRGDRSFDFVRGQRTGDAVMLRMHADEVPSADHRNAIYVRHAVLERLSLAWTMADGSLLAVNLYHHAHQGRFQAVELERFADAAPVLRAAVERHIDWQGEQARPGPRDLLKQHCAQLTARELDVLERLVRGLTYDGIAADLGLTVSTVKTYRARAFERLGIHFKSQLFARLRPTQ